MLTPIQRNPRAAASLKQLEAEKMKTTLLHLHTHLDLLEAWQVDGVARAKMHIVIGHLKEAIELIEADAERLLGEAYGTA